MKILLTGLSSMVKSKRVGFQAHHLFVISYLLVKQFAVLIV